MIIVNYGELSNKSMSNYFNFLVGKFFKIMPLKESGCKTLNVYLKSLQRELIGNAELLCFLKEEPQFISLLNILQYFISNEFTNNECSTDVKKAIRIINSINQKYFSGGDADAK